MTTEHPATGPQIDAEPPEPVSLADDTGEPATEGGDAQEAVGEEEPHPFTPEDYAALAAEADQQNEVLHDVTLDDADGDGVAALRRENARRRLRLTEAETKLEAAGAENERLSGLVTEHLRQDAERIAAETLVDARDLWRVTDLDGLLVADGTGVDPDKLRAVIADMPGHWVKPPQSVRYHYGLSSGATGRSVDTRPISWADAIGPLAE